ncbi:unnamed protein product [Parascedosporium putredinis]|uniref:Uncharacterized protein n=1 Tax=Parascedosporium putredinis TaxID=1442378 RepID=A0A9P1GXM8_9PEZI|nr:unnamed protein product [Parascedosporium putredinis]CAI7990739.1 unnamed protein product [Parascedosporium putredinis]
MRHQLSSCLSLLLAVAGTRGFVVPQGLPDGVYLFDFDPESGSIINEPQLLKYLTPAASPRPPLHSPGGGPEAPPEPGTLLRRDVPQPRGFRRRQDPVWWYLPKDTQYPVNQAVVITYGSAMAYMCNWDSFTNRCWTKEYEEASGIIDVACQNSLTGTVYVDRWKKTYGRDVAGADICLGPPAPAVES